MPIFAVFIIFSSLIKGAKWRCIYHFTILDNHTIETFKFYLIKSSIGSDSELTKDI